MLRSATRIAPYLPNCFRNLTSLAGYQLSLHIYHFYDHPVPPLLLLPVRFFNSCHCLCCCPYSTPISQIFPCERNSFSMLLPFHKSPLSLNCLAVPKLLYSSESECATSTNDVDKLYSTIVSNSAPNRDNLERALDQVSRNIKLTTTLVIEVLHRLRFEEKLAFRFFTWTAHQHCYSPEPQVYNLMIDILSSTKYKVRQFRIICDILDYMKRNNKKSVPVEVLLTILRQYTEKHLTHLHKFAKKKKIKVKTPTEINAFNLLLDALCKCSLVEDAQAMFSRMKSKIKPDAHTYNILFFGWCRVRNPIKGMSVLEDMIKEGHMPDNFTYNTAIDTFCKVGLVEEGAQLLEFMRTKGSTFSSPTAKTYTIMIVALIQNDRMEQSFELLGDMINRGCLPDVATYKELIEGMCLAGKVEAAYKFLEEMGKKGYPPDVVTYNCFLKVLCDQKNNDEAFRLYGHMIEGECTPSVHTYNMLITMSFEMGEPIRAFEMLNEMDKKGCARDTNTYCLMIEGFFGCNNTEVPVFFWKKS
ncbi:hypothetical protein NMG60_11036329 [Bertholletia excelsa]